MAGKKKSKKAAAKKPAKKAAPKKAAKSAKAGKAAKKAAPKKAAPKQAAAKKAAPKKKVAAKKPAVKKAPKEAIEVVEADQVDTTEVETTARESDGAGGGVTLQSEILAMAKQLYGERSDDELLEFDPNSVDAMDPNNFYELIAEKYGVQADAADDNFGGFGGPIRNTIAFVEARWDGQTRKDTPMPPGDWLEEYVHPES